MNGAHKDTERGMGCRKATTLFYYKNNLKTIIRNKDNMYTKYKFSKDYIKVQ